MRLNADQHAEPLRRNFEACASHLGTIVQSTACWAREHGLTEGDLVILAIDPLGKSCPGLPLPDGCMLTSGLVFSTIPLSA